MATDIDIRNRLVQLLPYGLVVTRKWMMQQGFGRHIIDNLVKSSQLKAFASGVYYRPETKLTWQGIVSSLQRMGFDIAVGGVSALEFHGLAHYLSLSNKKTIHLYGSSKLPSWVNSALPGVKFIHHKNRAWSEVPALDPNDPAASFLQEFSPSNVDWKLAISSPERAILEALDGVPEALSFEHADEIFQGLANLSPRRLDKILRMIKSVKIVRLFFWFSDRQQHSWLTKMDIASYNLGHGNRVLATGGKLDKTYKITVPEHMHG